LARQPQLLLPDEPTSALDLKHQVTVAVEGGPAVIAVMHDRNLAARFADHLIVLHEGRVHSNGVRMPVLSNDILAEVFEVEAVPPSPNQNPMGFVPVQASSSRRFEG
jgi:iron complex transport system ATP-binding protein